MLGKLSEDCSEKSQLTAFVVVRNGFDMIAQLLDKWVLAGLFILGVVVYYGLVTIREEMRIKKLGGRGVVVRGWLPFGNAPRP